MAEENATTTEINPKHAEAAYLEVAAEAKALPASAVSAPRLRVGEVVLAALKMARFVKQPEVRSRFMAMPNFDSKHVDNLASYALALWYADNRRELSAATAGGAKVSAELLERASERRTRMIELMDFYLADRRQVVAEVNAIKSGQGYMDLASDLGELSRLHRENNERLSTDPSGRYRADDPEQAATDAANIMRELSQSSDPKDAQTWADAQARCWTLLRTSYETVTRAATWLYGDRPDFDDLFPSLFTAGRRAPRQPSSNHTQELPPPAPAA